MGRKSNKGLIGLVIILLIGVIGLGGYIVYDKVINKDNEPKTEKKEEIKNEKTSDVEETVKETKQATQILNTDVGTFIVDKDGSVYYAKSVDNYQGVEIKTDDNTIGTYGTYEVSDYVTGLGYDESTKKTTEDHKFEGYKLDLENISSAYDINVGQGGKILYFLSKEGKVNELRFIPNGENSKIELKKDTCTKSNIVSVLQSSGFDAFEFVLVDKDGNRYTGTELAEENKR